MTERIRDTEDEARRGKTRERRLALGVVAAVVGALLLAAASVGISVALAEHSRARSDCLIEARNVEFDGLKLEIHAATQLFEFAIRHRDPNEAQVDAAVGTYQDTLVRADRKYADAERLFATC